MSQAPKPSLNPTPQAGFEPSSRLCVFLLLALPVALFWPALIGGKMLWGADIQTLEFVFKTAAHRSLALGEWPHWMPEILGGMPGIAASNLVFLHPLELLFCLLGLPAWAGFGLDAAAEVALSGLGMYLLLKRLGASNAGALLAGLFFASSGTQISLLFAGHINNIKGIAMIPWVFWGAHKGFHEERWLGWALSGAALALQVLGLGLQIYAYTIIALAGFAAWMAWTQGTKAYLRAFIGLALAGLFSFLLSAPQLIPSLQYKPYSWREGFSYEQFISWSFHPKEALGWIVPGFYGWRAPTYHGDWPFCLTTEYMGLLPWALAAVAPFAAAGKGKGIERFLLGLVVFSFLAGIGKHFPLHHVFYHLPVYNGFRTWTRFLCLLTFGVCALAGLGWDRLPQDGARKAGLGVAAFMAVVALLSLAAKGDALAQASGLKALALALVLAVAFWRLPLKWLLAGALVFHVYDLRETHQRYLEFKAPQELLARPAFLSVLPDGLHGEPFRILDLPNVWQQNAGALYGFETLQGYHGVQMAAPMKLTQALSGRQLDWLNLMNTRYVISPQAMNVPGWKLLAPGPIYVYENPGALARAFLVGSAQVVPTDEAAFSALADPKFPVLQSITLPQDPQLPGGPLQGGVRWVERGRNHLVLEAQATRDCLLVISQTWYPAWVASVDGQSTPVLKADGGALQAIRLPAGKHQVEFRYATGSFKASVGLCLLGLLALGWLAKRGKISATPL